MRDCHYTYTLRQRSSDETLRGPDKHRMFCQAVVEGQLPRIRNFLRIGVDLDEKNQYGLTALHCAILGGHEDVVEPLVEAGADVNACSDHFGTPLCLAALKGMHATVSLLLRYRAKADTRTKLLGTALHCCVLAVGENKDIAIALIAAQASLSAQVTIDTRWLSVVCSYDGDPRCQMALPAKLEGCTLFDVTPAFLAVRFRHGDMLELLLPSHLDQVSRIQFFASQNQNLPSHGSLLMRKMLAGRYESIMTPPGHTLLSSCATIGDIESVRLLIAKGATPQSSDKDVTPLICAATHGSTEMTTLLLDSGASINRCNVSYGPGATALHWAAAGGNNEVVRILCERGADIEKRDSKKRTSLACAMRGFAKVCVIREVWPAVAVLIDDGADLEPRDEDGLTPLLALLKASTIDFTLLENLVEAGADTRALTSDGVSVLWLCMSRSAPGLLCSTVGRGLGIDADTLERLRAHADRLRREGWKDRIYELVYSSACDGLGGLRPLYHMGANLNAQNSAGWTAMHFAAAYGDVATIDRLVAAGFSLAQLSIAKGRSPLAVAVHYQNVRAVRLLLSHGADPHARGACDNAQSAIDIAIDQGQNDLLHLLNSVVERLPAPNPELLMGWKRGPVAKKEPGQVTEHIDKLRLSSKPQSMVVSRPLRAPDSRLTSSAAADVSAKQAAEPQREPQNDTGRSEVQVWKRRATRRQRKASKDGWKGLFGL
jgi:ankyrin repeat protein